MGDSERRPRNPSLNFNFTSLPDITSISSPRKKRPNMVISPDNGNSIQKKEIFPNRFQLST